MHRNARPLRLMSVAAMLVLTCACGEDGLPLAPGAHATVDARADPARGRRLLAERGCLACHTLSGARGPAAAVGPPLDDLWRQAYVAGVLPNTADNLARWLRDPPAVNPRTAMPDTGLRAADARDIAAYLLLPAHARGGGP
ncbi:c-type cytochrome [Achromobacter xylosoxidans]